MYIILIIAAVSKGSPVQVAMIRTIGIVFSFVLQTQNNEASPTMYAYCGAAVIAGTAFLMTFETKIDKILESCSNCPSTQVDEEATQPQLRTITANKNEVIIIRVD
jgi:hypothetical protein